MRKRHINEFRKTSFANNGRAAGMGMLYDRYDDNAVLDNHIRQGRPIPIAEIEEKAKQETEESPVTVYYIKEEENEL